MVTDAEELLDPKGRVAWIMGFLKDPSPTGYKIVQRTSPRKRAKRSKDSSELKKVKNK